MRPIRSVFRMAFLLLFSSGFAQSNPHSLGTVWSPERFGKNTNAPAKVLGTARGSAFMLLQSKHTGGDGSFGFGEPYAFEEVSLDGLVSLRKEEVSITGIKNPRIKEVAWANDHINVTFTASSGKEEVMKLRKIGLTDLKPMGEDVQLLPIPRISGFRKKRYWPMPCDARGNIIILVSYSTSQERGSERSSIITFDAQGGSMREFILQDIWPCQDAYDQIQVTNEGALVFIGNRAAPPPVHMRDERCLVYMKEGETKSVIHPLDYAAKDPGIPGLFRSAATGDVGLATCGMETGTTRLRTVTVHWLGKDGTLDPGLQAAVDPVIADELIANMPEDAGRVVGFAPKVVEDTAKHRLYFITELLVEAHPTKAIFREGVLKRATTESMRADINGWRPSLFTADILVSCFNEGSFVQHALIRKAQFGHSSNHYLGYACMAHENGLTIWFNAKDPDENDRPDNLKDLSYERADAHVATAHIPPDGQVRLTRIAPPNEERIFRMRPHVFGPVVPERALLCLDEAPAIDGNIGRAARDVYFLGLVAP